MIKKALNFLLIISVFFASHLFSQETDDEKKKLKLLAAITTHLSLIK
jgi:hypothetical protein